MFKVLRIIVLLLILATVAQTVWLARSRATAWENTLTVGIYPIAADDSANTRNYIGTLKPDTFRVIDEFFDAEAKRHGLTVWRPVSIAVASPTTDQPPQPPRNANALLAILWSLQMRWWAFRHGHIDGPKPAVRLFVLFHDPEINPRLAHSVGIERGMFGVINTFSSQAMAGSNAMIVAHELLHTLGATDKYDPATNRPRYPDGYAEPELEPRHPQEFAEIMGGRIPLSPTEAETPRSLDRTLVGPATAREIGWLRK
jgi:hypothetical protein